MRTSRGGPAERPDPLRDGGAGSAPGVAGRAGGPLVVARPPRGGRAPWSSPVGPAVAIGVSGSFNVLVAGSGADWLLGSSGPEAGWASRAPMSVSVGAESDGAVSAAETVLPCDSGVSLPPAGLLGELGTGSSR